MVARHRFYVQPVSRFDHTLLILFYSFLPAKRQRKRSGNNDVSKRLNPGRGGMAISLGNDGIVMQSTPFRNAGIVFYNICCRINAEKKHVFDGEIWYPLQFVMAY